MSKIAILGIAGESVFLSVDSFGVTGKRRLPTAFTANWVARVSIRRLRPQDTVRKFPFLVLATRAM